MISRVLVGAALTAALVAPPAAVAAPLTVSGLTANREAAPLGLGDARPALGWTLGVKQSIAASDPLRTGTYAKTLVFTLSTTSPSPRIGRFTPRA